MLVNVMKLYVFDKQSEDRSCEDESKSVLDAERKFKSGCSLVAFDVSDVMKNLSKEKFVEEDDHENASNDYA